MTAPNIALPQEVTPLSPKQETQFQQWAKKNKITDVDSPDSHYDYRGFWLAKGPVPIRFGRDHFPDTYKQHGHPTFSVESQYSRGPNDGGIWAGDQYIPQKTISLLMALTRTPFADSLGALGGHPTYAITPDQTAPNPPYGTAHLSGQVTGDPNNHFAPIIQLTSFLLNHASQQGDPSSSGYGAIPGQTWGDHTLAHETGHLIQSQSQGHVPDAFHSAIRDMGNVDSETFAEGANQAIQFLRSGQTNTGGLSPVALRITKALLLHPLYARHPINGTIK